jgi:hypothetical protein
MIERPTRPLFTRPDGLPFDPKGDTDSQQALSIQLALALDGCNFATLTHAQLELFNFYRDQGRKYGLAATVVCEANSAELAEVKLQSHQDEIMRRLNGTVSIVRC